MKHLYSFGVALRLMRDSKGLTQDALGITQTNISKFELGKKVPSLERLAEIADHLNVHPVTLFTLAYMGGAREDALDEISQVVHDEIVAMIKVLKDKKYWGEGES
ncbi:helix-turn-helix domain-containing protein [Pseudomonas aeruginosa]|uniref:helix-turn-helix domain-containing protein n=1 Tax=Pseudomonas aeruginosa TaxID=287 RepID=UPI001588232D|nr:helix-turn-helix transcriptional regulator [Pseudomonas aeruginosa]MCT5519323.1 helix-turn-helix domain-containing protein [Pseudomonas aeruginosa]MEE2515678.1 helix-turn-helix transcriptional regulator [Pseudomonas aeruginosa]HEJ1327458.1 helix-turn-helix transcriptional regulator [Pseudomonas aeruginosa]